MALRHRVATVASYPPRRWGDLIVAACVALRVEYALHRRGLQQAAEVGNVSLAMDGVAAPVALPHEAGLSTRELEQLDAAWRLLRWGPFNGTCLRRAIVGGYFIRERHPKLRIGVTKSAGSVAAHAWLEVAGVGLDPDGARRYPVLQSPTEPK